jgi:NADH:ubiquinone oxidoreductase subunit 2 (subunit N)
MLAVVSLAGDGGAGGDAAGVRQRVVALGGLFELDRMAQVLKVVTLLTVAVVFVYSTDYLRRRAILKGEYYVLGCSRPWARWC